MQSQNIADRCGHIGRWDGRIYRRTFRPDGVFDAAARSSHRADSCARPAESKCSSMRKESSPCLTCTRVKNPGDCENKNCRVWRAWFTASWDRARMHPRLQMEKDRSGLEGVSICGTTYILPDRVREYLQNSPCKTCPMPMELCTSPCPAYRTWQETRKEVSL